MATLALLPVLHLKQDDSSPTADDERAALKELYLCINCIVRYTVTQAESGGRSSSAVFRMVNGILQSLKLNLLSLCSTLKHFSIMSKMWYFRKRSAFSMVLNLSMMSEL